MLKIIFREIYRKKLKSNNFNLTIKLLSSPRRLIGFLAMHSFGVSLIYPGSTSFLFYLSKIFFYTLIQILFLLCYLYCSGSEFAERKTNFN